MRRSRCASYLYTRTQTYARIAASLRGRLHSVRLQTARALEHRDYAKRLSSYHSRAGKQRRCHYSSSIGKTTKVTQRRSTSYACGSRDKHHGTPSWATYFAQQLSIFLLRGNNTLRSATKESRDSVREFLAKHLLGRLAKPRRFIQVVAGPRQTGKTTAVQQALSKINLRHRFARASQDLTMPREWLRRE